MIHKQYKENAIKDYLKNSQTLSLKTDVYDNLHEIIPYISTVKFTPVLQIY